MFCTSCGIRMGASDRFCPQCGHGVNGAAPAQASNYIAGPAAQLTRSLRNRKIAGVCGGLGKYFAVDPTIVRVLFVAAFFCGVLPSVVPYIICWVVMPLEAPEPWPVPSNPYLPQGPSTHPSSSLSPAPMPR